VESFGQVGVLGRCVFYALEEEKLVKTKEEKIFFFPCFADQGKKKTHSAVQNSTVSGFFLMNSV
jgi:hypothetical protein